MSEQNIGTDAGPMAVVVVNGQGLVLRPLFDPMEQFKLKNVASTRHVACFPFLREASSSADERRMMQSTSSNSMVSGVSYVQMATTLPRRLPRTNRPRAKCCSNASMASTPICCRRLPNLLGTPCSPRIAAR